MSFTFYRKYRPTKFADVIGQEAIVKTLENSLTQNRVAHAYLFTGPRGTGKTTLARLLAKAVNCQNRKGFEPCGKCVHCVLQEEGRTLDIIEIDAASHTGVDNIRELKETVHLSPTVGTHKVYIIDEAHMLSLGAWNALLKTLEEPPAHVIFIMATTRIDKVPETILSRAIRFDLARFPLEKIVEKLAKIAKAEKIKIDTQALTLIARAAQGGMRDAEVLFTQIATLEESPIEADRVALLLGTTSYQALGKLMHFVADNNLSDGLHFLRELKDAGGNLPHLALSMLDYLRKLLFFSLDAKEAEKLVTDMTKEEKAELTTLAAKLGSERIVEALERFQEAHVSMKDSPIPELPLEIALAKLITPRKTTPSDSSPKDDSESGGEGVGVTRSTKTTPPSTPAPKKSVTLPVEKKAPLQSKAEDHKKSAPPLDFNLVRERWQQIVNHAKALNAGVGVALSSAVPIEVRDNRLVLRVKYPFHKERLEAKAHRLTLGTAFDTILGFQVTWITELEPEEAPREASPLVSQALEMLGGKLVQES